MQRHKERSELWFVSEGCAKIYTLSRTNGDIELLGYLKRFDSITIPTNQWHMLSNETYNPLKIIEVQFGINCIEDDIERNNNYESE